MKSWAPLEKFDPCVPAVGFMMAKQFGNEEKKI